MRPAVPACIRSSQLCCRSSLVFLLADLERELMSLKREETRLISEIKKAAQAGNQPSTRILAKSLVRVRGQQTKIHAGIAQMQGVKSGMTVSCI